MEVVVEVVARPLLLPPPTLVVVVVARHVHHATTGSSSARRTECHYWVQAKREESGRAPRIAAAMPRLAGRDKRMGRAWPAQTTAAHGRPFLCQRTHSATSQTLETSQEHSFFDCCAGRD